MGPTAGLYGRGKSRFTGVRIPNINTNTNIYIISKEVGQCNTPWRSITNLSRRSLFSKSYVFKVQVTIRLYRRPSGKYVLGVPVFTNLVNVHRHYFRISYTKFQQNQKINTEFTCRNSFTHSIRVWVSITIIRCCSSLDGPNKASPLHSVRSLRCPVVMHLMLLGHLLQ